MDIYVGDDPYAWLYSARAETQAELMTLSCYEDPPRSLHRAGFESIGRTRVTLPCCGSDDPETGTIHGMRRV